MLKFGRSTWPGEREALSHEGHSESFTWRTFEARGGSGDGAFGHGRCRNQRRSAFFAYFHVALLLFHKADRWRQNVPRYV